jgi:formamidopyrimidine-DNA glycosylase
MPEGDTVFITAQRLNEALSGRTVTRFDLRVPALALADERGTSVTAVVSNGKHLLIRMASGRTLHSHLRMDGAWRVGPATQRARGGADHEIRALVGNDEWLAAGFRVHDLALVATRDEASLVGHLGPDLLDQHFDRAEALRRFRDRADDTTIGDALLDQRLVAGIGNVYKSELLFLRRLNPWHTVGNVEHLDLLLDDAVRLLNANRGRFSRSTTGWTQPGQQYYVYGRNGRPCRRCGTIIRRDEQGTSSMERVLYYCPSCQNVS